MRSLAWEAGLRYWWYKDSAFGEYPGFIEVGRRFSIRVRETLKQQPSLGPDSIFFAYDTGALEAFEWCREHRIRCVLNQMDPNRVEVDLVRAEEKQWPGWQKDSIQVPEEYLQRREKEWALANRIVVNSEFSRQALIRQGVPPEKLVIIPLCFEPDRDKQRLATGDQRVSQQNSTAGEPQSFASASAINYQLSTVSSDGSMLHAPCSSPSVSAFDPRSGSELKPLHAPCSLPSALSASPFALSPLRILFLGQVILRKGIQYLIQAAKLLKDVPIHFDIVGPIGISQKAIASAPKNVMFHGRATRDQTSAWYQKSHLFVLPTISDGFAITQLEAMSYGLPVVTTPCCGEVVTDGLDGFIVPTRDSSALAQVFQRYLQNPELLKTQSHAALLKSQQFTLAHLTANLLKLEASLLAS